MNNITELKSICDKENFCTIFGQNKSGKTKLALELAAEYQKNKKIFLVNFKTSLSRLKTVENLNIENVTVIIQTGNEDTSLKIAEEIINSHPESFIMLDNYPCSEEFNNFINDIKEKLIKQKTIIINTTN